MYNFFLKPQNFLATFLLFSLDFTEFAHFLHKGGANLGNNAIFSKVIERIEETELSLLV